MGGAGLIEAGSAVAKATAASLRTWGLAVSEAAHLAPGIERKLVPVALDQAPSFVRPVEEALVRTTGWEMRNAVSWRNDGLCVERAAVTALSAAQHEAGSVPGALAALTTADARLGATIVTYRPTSQLLGSFDNLHAAAYFRTTAGRELVIDHTFAAPGGDGVMDVADWLRLIGGRADDTRLMPSNYLPAASAHPSGAGVPSMATPMGAQEWLTEVGTMVDKLDPPVRTRDRYGALIRR